MEPEKKLLFVILIILFITLFLSQTNTLGNLLPDTLKFIHLTDTHICNLTGYHPEFAKSRQHYGNGVKPLAQFFGTAPGQYDIDAIIITGDLIDYFEAETVQGAMLATQIEQFLPLYFDCPVPLYLTLGNHDIASYWIDEPENKESFQKHAHQARATWIRSIPCFQYGTYYARSFQVGQTSYRFLLLDNGYSQSNGSLLDQQQLEWLEYQVQLAGSNPVIIFMHKYLPIPDYNGDGIFFSNKNVLTIDSTTCATGFLKILNDNTRIKALLVGHGHKSVTETILMPGGHRIVQTETAGFANDPGNWRLLKFTENHIIIMPCGQDREGAIINSK